MTSNSDDNQKRTVRAGRRRPSSPSQPEERQQAEAPQRRKPTGQGAYPSYPSEGGGGASTPGIPVGQLFGGGGRSPLLVLLIILCLALAGVPILLNLGGQDTGEVAYTQPAEIIPEVQSTPAPPTSKPPTKVPAKPSSSSQAKGQTWLVMLYQDADDKILEQDIFIDLNEAERVGSSDRVKIVAQMDRYKGGYQGDGDWVSAKRFFITQDDDLQRIRSETVADLGEVNMSDSDTLVDFVNWAVETYPANKYLLILSDHGMGWPGGWSDPTSTRRGSQDIPLTTVLGNQMYLMEIDQALDDIRAATGIDKLELIGLDACLMSHMEVLSALEPHARFAVTSQEVEPSLGWAYTAFLEALQANPDMSGAELSKIIVDSYIEEDQRIVDDQARAEFLKQGSPMGSAFGFMGGPTAAQITEQIQRTITLAAVDLSAMPKLSNAVNDLSYALQNEDQRQVAQARNYAQSFTSIFGNQVPPSYIDLGNFAQFLKRQTTNPAVSQAVDQVMSAIQQAVIAEKHGKNKPGATGVSIYFPNSQVYRAPAAGPQSYTAIARRFAGESLWDDFLAYHYAGRSFTPDTQAAAVPSRSEPISAPGQGEITLSPITLSSQVASSGQPVLLSSDINGDNIGYIKIFAGYFDQQANSIFVADVDFLESMDTREIDGVYYPDWGEGDFTLEFEWEPLMFAINDGVNTVTALLNPQTYGATPEDAIYTVDGIYTYADSGDQRNARLYFSNGVLRQVYGFTGEADTGAPREITPQTGDTFTVLENWWDLDQIGNVAQSTTQEGDTLTFSDQMFTWQELDAAPGNYIVGFIVEDLDGNANQAFTQVRVR